MVCRQRIIAVWFFCFFFFFGLFLFGLFLFLLLTAQQHLGNRNQDFLSENFTLESVCTKSLSLSVTQVCLMPAAI